MTTREYLRLDEEDELAAEDDVFWDQHAGDHRTYEQRVRDSKAQAELRRRMREMSESDHAFSPMIIAIHGLTGVCAWCGEPGCPNPIN